MKKESVSYGENPDFLNQLIISLEQAEIKMEQAYKRKKTEQFNAAKQFLLKLNKKIAESL